MIIETHIDGKIDVEIDVETIIKEAEKLWVALQESERIAIFEHLPKYNYYLKTHQGLMKAYPETFLNQRRWENEYQ